MSEDGLDGLPVDIDSIVELVDEYTQKNLRAHFLRFD